MISFFIPGQAATKGSPHLARKKDGTSFMAPDSDALKRWSKVAKTIAASKRPARPFAGPVRVELRFVFPRPEGHYRGKARVLREDAPAYPVARLDIDKLARGLLDTLVPHVLVDDVLVVNLSAAKLYGAVPGCWVSVESILEAA